MNVLSTENAEKKENVFVNSDGEEKTVLKDTALMTAQDMENAPQKEFANVLITGKELIAQIEIVPLDVQKEEFALKVNAFVLQAGPEINVNTKLV